MVVCLFRIYLKVCPRSLIDRLAENDQCIRHRRAASLGMHDEGIDVHLQEVAAMGIDEALQRHHRIYDRIGVRRPATPVALQERCEFQRRERFRVPPMPIMK